MKKKKKKEKFRKDTVLKILVSAAAQLFPVAVIYTPDQKDVLAVHFAMSEEDLLASCQEYINNEKNAISTSKSKSEKSS